MIAAPRPRHLAGLLAVTLALAACTSTAPTSHSTAPPSNPVQTISLPADAGTPGSNAPARRTATILGSGDVLIHPPLWEQAHNDAGRHGYDFGPMYASIKPDVEQADLAICEMETPLAPPQGPFVGWPDFSAPPQVLTALKGVGYDSCTTASNHT
ncbi:MAG TPA: CapA family protein, partial [Jatrophihabitans sp.]|nr:CapA family protein [Jatrophihabitans sp.]